jgi:predicted ATP-dependent serine protease
MGVGKGKTTTVVEQALELKNALIVTGEDSVTHILKIARRIGADKIGYEESISTIRIVKKDNLHQIINELNKTLKANVFVDGFKLDMDDLKVLNELEIIKGFNLTVTVQVNRGFSDSQKIYSNL